MDESFTRRHALRKYMESNLISKPRVAIPLREGAFICHAIPVIIYNFLCSLMKMVFEVSQYLVKIRSGLATRHLFGSL